MGHVYVLNIRGSNFIGSLHRLNSTKEEEFARKTEFLPQNQPGSEGLFHGCKVHNRFSYRTFNAEDEPTMFTS